jgi:L-rhamnose-H+ transport protein
MFAAGIAVLVLAGFFQGTYGLGMKKYEPFSWEAMWAIFSIVGMVITPCVWASITVPGFFQYIAAAPGQTILMAAFCGFFWGVSAIGFGKAIDYIGISLTNGIAYGVSCIVGALVPLFMSSKVPSSAYVTGLVIGIVLLVIGLALFTKAGLLRDAQGAETEKGRDPRFKTGLILAFISGLGGAAQNIGFTYAGVTSQLAVAGGVSATNAAVIPWIVVVSMGGFVANIGYALVLLAKNKNFHNYTDKGCGVGYAKSALTGIAWYAALGVYGIATVLLGGFGPVVGWIGFNALGLIIANAWGLKDGEWEGYDKAKKFLLSADGILIVSLVILGISNTL